MLLWEWNEIRCGKALLKILKSHPQVRSYYIPAHPEVKSLEANFWIKLLGSGSSHHVVLLSLPTHTGKEFSVTCRGRGCRRSLGRLFSWKDNGLRDALIVEQRVDASVCYTHLLPPGQESDRHPGACTSMPQTTIINLEAMYEKSWHHRILHKPSPRSLPSVTLPLTLQEKEFKH